MESLRGSAVEAIVFERFKEAGKELRRVMVINCGVAVRNGDLGGV